jgi:hypothetical protein
MEEPKSTRTAADVLLSLEAKVDQLMGIQRAMDLTIKVLTNRFNQLLDALTQEPTEDSQVSAPSSPFAIATAPPFPEAPQPMTMETEPVGFRRTSRPETYSQDPRPQKMVPTPSISQPQGFPAREPENPAVQDTSGSKKQLMQRVLDKNGKALFMAEVEILDVQNNTVHKGRTDGVGKWHASLPLGKYKVVLRKRDVQGKNNIEITQDLTVDGRTPTELQMMVVK